MTHPIWYYDYFNYLFGRSSAQYDFEIECLNRLNNMNGQRVLEIGAGTGEHATRLLRLLPTELVLVDKDLRAIRILEKKFHMIPIVKIQLTDGFSFDGNDFDAVVCMYSVIQRVKDDSELINRIETLINFVRHGGICLFEMIDAEKSKQIHPPGEITNLQDSAVPLNVKVWSDYEEKYFTINYEGYFKDQEIAYRVPLLSMNVESLLDQLRMYQLRQIKIEPLDKHSRRVLVGIRR